MTFIDASQMVRALEPWVPITAAKASSCCLEVSSVKPVDRHKEVFEGQWQAVGSKSHYLITEYDEFWGWS